MIVHGLGYLCTFFSFRLFLVVLVLLNFFAAPFAFANQVGAVPGEPLPALVLLRLLLLLLLLILLGHLWLWFRFCLSLQDGGTRLLWDTLVSFPPFPPFLLPFFLLPSFGLR